MPQTVPAPQAVAAVAPVPAAAPFLIAVVLRGPLAPRALGPLVADPRVQLCWASEVVAGRIPSGERTSAVLVVAENDPLDALAYAAMSGLGSRLVMAIPPRCMFEKPDLLEAGALACLSLPLDAVAVETLVDMLTRQAGPMRGAAVLRLSMDAASLTVRYRDGAVRLTPREYALMHCLVERRGRDVRADELLSVAWADSARAQGSRRVLELYVHQLRRKLAVLGLADSLATVRGVGYALRTSVS